ncbi:hypothetical protein GUITHDRAFT_140912 [Guillardia theta CCMP2712]|uniref:Uncharacterized protein n=1 Tax=Guillardia theta (strain CCMP2712) TaxID=905079 RepID=L1J3Q0_GUITC|nr:hypothetical protein GUITHDRAFT_140912 [Guillardia theta CCMP2712]EKX42749.1 hypothetical protein GUITHDRAFT_140912 [Guillardia theta CCMP2712]|eukprot:XP_005829729.1 hypothetical protein GUITHDRAFT_140912 [Guillardia theta CCMP2712]
MARAFPAILRAMEELKEMEHESQSRYDPLVKVNLHREGTRKKHRFISCIERSRSPVASTKVKYERQAREEGGEEISGWRSEWLGGKLIPGMEWRRQRKQGAAREGESRRLPEITTLSPSMKSHKLIKFDPIVTSGISGASAVPLADTDKLASEEEVARRIPAQIQQYEELFKKIRHSTKILAQLGVSPPDVSTDTFRSSSIQEAESRAAKWWRKLKEEEQQQEETQRDLLFAETIRRRGKRAGKYFQLERASHSKSTSPAPSLDRTLSRL